MKYWSLQTFMQMNPVKMMERKKKRNEPFVNLTCLV